MTKILVLLVVSWLATANVCAAQGDTSFTKHRETIAKEFSASGDGRVVAPIQLRSCSSIALRTASLDFGRSFSVSALGGRYKA